jgi:hypothetical protein
MFNIRIVSAIGVAAIASVLMSGGAMAQFVVMEPVIVPVGPPVALLAGLNPPHEYRTHRVRTFAHPRAASRTSRRMAARRPARNTKLASWKHHAILAAQPVDPPVQTTAEALPENALPQNASPKNALPENAWPSQPTAASQTTPSNAALPSDNAVPAPEAAAADSQTTPSAVVVGGQTVDVAAPDQANAIDLAADDRHDPAVSGDRTDPDPPAQRVLAAPVHKDESPVGSASWIAQVLAAFGGAVTAGAVAWFLIGGGSRRRMYG